tara:strand:+ start:690 stop:1595 length:906 start_codon:yes stop_codon:yes gene_type:complete
MNHLELFSGTHSFGKISSELGYNVISLDRDLGDQCPFSDYVSNKHIKEDILTWNYKVYPKGYFKLITASPVCLWWSNLRNTWIGRKLRSHGDTIITKEILDEDIEKFGVPMVDKVFEIIDYFEPQYYLIENPMTGKMKQYINELIPYYDIDYCKYSDWGYKKTSRFWTNIEGFTNKRCKNDCDNMITIKTQDNAIHTGKGTLIKSDYRKMHKNPLGDQNKANDKCNKIKQNLHKDRMGSTTSIIDNGVIIHLNTKELRKKYKHKKDVSINLGGGSNRLERYRIPPKLIHELFNLTILLEKV